MSAKNLGKKIKEARLERGLKQSELAGMVGISTQSISAFESGRIKPDRKYVEKIAQFTKKPLHFFTGQKIAEAISRIDEMMLELQKIRQILSEANESEE